jgi:hypothetical protein
VALSVLVLFSTLSLTIEKHFCGDVLVDVAVFTETEKCADDIAVIDETVITKKSCCKDEIDVIEGIELTTNSFNDLYDIQQQILLAYSFSYHKLFEGLPNLVITHKDYSPPRLVIDIHLLDETYLI